MKIGNLYNLDSYKRCVASVKTSGFADAFAGTILERTLTMVDPTLFEKKFPALAFVNSGIESDNTGGFAQRIQSLRLLATGGFTTAGDSARNKGKISLTAEDSFLKVIEREAHSTWTDTEVQQAQMAGINLVSQYVAKHNEIYLREIDLSGFCGIDSTQKGLLNFAGFVSNAAAGVVNTLTSQAAYDAISGLIQNQWNGVNNITEYKATRVVMPDRVFNFLAAKILDTTNGSSSVLRALQDNYPGIQFASTPRADSIANGGNLSVSTVAAYSVNRESMVFRIPQALTIGEIIKVGSFDFKVDSKYRLGGLDVLETKSGELLTGL